MLMSGFKSKYRAVPCLVLKVRNAPEMLVIGCWVLLLLRVEHIFSVPRVLTIPNVFEGERGLSSNSSVYTVKNN